MSKIEVSLDDATQAYARYQELNPRGHNEEFEGIVGEIRELDLLVPDQVEAVQEQRRLLLQTRYFRTLFESLVAQLEDNPDWADNRADSDETVEEAPRTFLKTVEDILVKPEDRMAVAREDEGGIDIDSMIISPERITPTLLKNLGLEEHLPPKGTKRVKRIKAYAAAIPAIKEMLSHLEPIRYPGTEDHTEESNLRYFRLMRMGAGPNEGMILGTQNVRKTDDNERGEKVLFKTDLHASERRVLHIYESYREEMRKLASIEEGLRGVRKTLSNWTADKVRDNEHRLATMKQELLKIAATLNPQIIQNRHKRAIAREISLSLTLKDSLDRYNPLIIGDRLDRAIDRIGERFKEIERISGFLGGDQARVTALTELQEAPLSAFCELVNELHEKFKLFERRPLGDDEKEVVLRNLNLTKEKAERLNYEPYLSLAKNFIERIDRVIDLLTTGPTEDFSQPAHQLAAEEFVKAYLVSKVAHAYRDLQTVYRKFSLNPENVDPRVIYDDVQRIQDFLANRDVAAEVMTPNFNAAWGELYHLCNGIKVELRPLIYGPKEGGFKQRSFSFRKEAMQRVLSRLGRLGGWLERRLEKRGLLDRPARAESSPVGESKRASYNPSLEERLTQFQAIKDRVRTVSFRNLNLSLS